MKPSDHSLPVLIGQSGPLKGERWVIRNPITVGRGEECEIVIEDRRISRRHALFTPNEAGILLQDLKSKNGTHHNGKAIKRSVLLTDGDLIQVALAQKFTFLSSDATIPLDLDLDIESGEKLPLLRLDKLSRRVWVRGEELIPPLSAAQFTLLQQLYEAKGSLVPRDNLVSKIWGKKEAYGVSDQALDALVRRLRDRIGALDQAHEYVVTVRGHGLRLNNPMQGQ
jgi:hypothetical protein